jgi:hypothetical protein
VSTSRGAPRAARQSKALARIGIDDLRLPALTPHFCRLDKLMPSQRHQLLGHCMGNFFIMGQKVTELFSIFDANTDQSDAVKLARHAQAMRVTSLGGVSMQSYTFEMVQARLLDPKPVLEVLLSNVYADRKPPAAKYSEKKHCLD